METQQQCLGLGRVALGRGQVSALVLVVLGPSNHPASSPALSFTAPRALISLGGRLAAEHLEMSWATGGLTSALTAATACP